MLALALVLGASGVASAQDAREQAKSQVEFGIAVAQKGLWQEAVFRWERAVEIDPTYAAAFNNLGIAYEQLGKFATGQLTPHLNVPSIDWSKQMVVVVSSGVQRRAPIVGVQVTKLNLHEDRLEVFWTSKPLAGVVSERRFGGSDYTQVPCETLLVSRYDGKIKVWDLNAALDQRSPANQLCIRTLMVSAWQCTFNVNS